MIEAAWVLAVLLTLGAITATQLLPWSQLIEAGQTVMVSAGVIGIPLEAVYFALLAFAIARHPECPRDWYWRSFVHHPLLTSRQRLWVLPWFYAGALAFAVITLGILMVLVGCVAAIRQA